MSMDDRLPAASTGRPADSQFLPGTKLQFAWDSVSLTSFMACPRRYQYTIIEGLVPRNPNYAIALVFGILFHKGLELYEKARFVGQDHSEAMHTALAEVLRSDAAQTLPSDEDIEEMADEAKQAADEDDGINLRNSRIRTRYYLARSLVWYLDHYDRDGQGDPVKTLALPTGKPAVEVSFRIPLPIAVADAELLLCGHIDRAVDFNGHLYVSDYKTTKSLTSQFFQMFDLSHQMTGYSTAGNVIFSKPAKGIVVDGIALQVGGVKLARHFTTRSKGQIREYFDVLKDVVQRATLLHARFADGQDYPMNTSACYFCDYKGICRVAPEYRKNYIKQQFEAKPGWNPLQNR